MHDDRVKYVQTNINEAEKQNKEAELNKQIANDELFAARQEAIEIIEKAKEQAEIVRNQKVDEAQLEAQKIISNTKNEMIAQKSKFEEDSKKEIIDIALIAAQKIIEKEVDNKTNREIIENFIKVKK